jgi:hypothetical protein
MDSVGGFRRTSPDEFLQRLKELVSNHAEGNTQLLLRFGDFLKQASASVSSTGKGERASVEQLLSRWLDFNLEVYSIVSTQGLALLNEILNLAQSTLLAQPAPGAGARPPTTQRVELKLSGHPGERATTSFVIENQFNHRLPVTFESTALTPGNGPTLPASLLHFDPAILIIDPRGQGIARIAVPITDDFIVGQTYTAIIRPLGFDAKEIALSLVILPMERTTEGAE